MTAAPLNVSDESNSAPSLGQRLMKWRGWVAPIAVLVLLLVGIGGASWIAARITHTTHQVAEDQLGVVKLTANVRHEALNLASHLVWLSDLPGDAAEETAAWDARYQAAVADHRKFESHLELLGERFETQDDWEEVEGCRDRVNLMIRSVDTATDLLTTLQRLANEQRSKDVTGTVLSLIDIYHNIDGQLGSLSSVGTEAAKKNLASLRISGQTLLTGWLAISIAVVAACGAVVFLRVRAERRVEDQEIVRLSQAGDPEADLSGCRVLLAEDGENNQRLIASILRRSGAEVAIAGDGKIALDQYFEAAREETPFDVLLLDLQMPNLDGLATLMKIVASGFSGGAIALATPAEADSRRACINAGFGDMLQKPVSRGELIAAVDRARSQHPEPQPA